MNKSEMIAAMAKSTKFTKKDTTVIFNTLIETITSTLAKGEMVVFTGFGSFEIRQRSARTVHNPQTGEKIQIPAQKVPIFRPGKTLKQSVKMTSALELLLISLIGYQTLLNE